jgi:hypothetical protein
MQLIILHSLFILLVVSMVQQLDHPMQKGMIKIVLQFLQSLQIFAFRYGNRDIVASCMTTLGTMKLCMHPIPCLAVLGCMGFSVVALVPLLTGISRFSLMGCSSLETIDCKLEEVLAIARQSWQPICPLSELGWYSWHLFGKYSLGVRGSLCNRNWNFFRNFGQLRTCVSTTFGCSRFVCYFQLYIGQCPITSLKCTFRQTNAVQTQPVLFCQIVFVGFLWWFKLMLPSIELHHAGNIRIFH